MVYCLKNMEIISFKGKKYLIQYKCPDTGFAPDEIDVLKGKFETPLVLKRNGELYFVQEVEDIEWEEIPSSGSKLDVKA